jgi:type IV pilus biogenesis protein CpaD/CtpE
MTGINKSRELTIKVDVDVSEALTGLKALQREAKKATQALRELEEAQNGNTCNITVNIPDKVDSTKIAEEIKHSLVGRGVSY